MSRRLTLDDISDLREYERDRDELRRKIIELKRLRRVAVGPVVSFVFENRETVRFQVQEMVRAERMLSDEQVQGELDAYNPLVPEPGELSATMFIELTDESEMRNWLPRLVGVERAPVLRISTSGNGAEATVVRSVPDPAHEKSLTRDAVTAAVHYVRFALDPAQVEEFASGRVELALDHPEYRHATVLTDETRAELMRDLRP